MCCIYPILSLWAPWGQELDLIFGSCLVRRSSKACLHKLKNLDMIVADIYSLLSCFINRNESLLWCCSLFLVIFKFPLWPSLQEEHVIESMDALCLPSSLPCMVDIRGICGMPGVLMEWADGWKEPPSSGKERENGLVLPLCFWSWTPCLAWRRDEARAKLTLSGNPLFFLVISVLENQQIFWTFVHFPRPQVFTLLFRILEFCH